MPIPKLLKLVPTGLFAILLAALLAALAACATGTASHHDAGDLRGRTILVAGGSGRAGAYLVRQLKADGLSFRATTRNLEQARQRLGADAEGVDWVQADLRDPAQAAAAVQGVDYVISVIGSREMSGPNSAQYVDFEGVQNLVDAAVKGKVRHFTLLTAIGTTDKESRGNKIFKGALEWRFKGEEYLRHSGLDYSIVRPAGLTDAPAGQSPVRLYQGDAWREHVTQTISRADLAKVLIATLYNAGARNASFEVANDPAGAAEPWQQQMKGLTPDP